jgi:hypothetical protein
VHPHFVFPQEETWLFTNFPALTSSNIQYVAPYLAYVKIQNIHLQILKPYFLNKTSNPKPSLPIRQAQTQNVKPEPVLPLRGS